MEDRPKLGDAPEKSGKRKKETAGVRRSPEQMHWLKLVGEKRGIFETPAATEKDKPEPLLSLQNDGNPKEKRIGAFVQELSERTEIQPNVPKAEYQPPEVDDLTTTPDTADLDEPKTKPFELPTLRSGEWTAWLRPKVETTPKASAEEDEATATVGGTEKTPESPDSPEPPKDRGPETMEGSGAGSPPERPPTDHFENHSEPTPEPHRLAWETAARQAEDRSTAERLPSPTRVVERRRNALGVLNFVGLVAEFFGRRRNDRKQTRESRRIQKEVKKLEQRLHQTESRPVERWAPPPESLNQPKLEAKPLPWQRVLNSDVPTPKAPPEKPSPQRESEPSEQLKKRLEALKSPEAHHLRPEEVLHQVEEAAKQKIAVEAIYERRHEIKDEAHSGVTPLGGLGGLADRPQTPPVPTGSHYGQKPYIPRPSPPPLTPDFSAASKQYGTAVRRGFWTALIIIIAIVIILLLK